MVFGEALLLSLVLLHHRADLQGVNCLAGGPVKCDGLLSGSARLCFMLPWLNSKSCTHTLGKTLQ
jgi:hypothetical protein